MRGRAGRGSHARAAAAVRGLGGGKGGAGGARVGRAVGRVGEGAPAEAPPVPLRVMGVARLDARHTHDWQRDWRVYRWIELVRSAYVDLDRLVTGSSLDAPNVRRAVASYGMTLAAATASLGLSGRPWGLPRLGLPRLGLG